MAFWDGARIVRFPPEPYPGNPGWERVDCGCCSGIEWGGEYPKECRTCGGTGGIALHKRSGLLAHYPGGPFCGRDEPAKDGEKEKGE